MLRAFVGTFRLSFTFVHLFCWSRFLGNGLLRRLLVGNALRKDFGGFLADLRRRNNSLWSFRPFRCLWQCGRLRQCGRLLAGPLPRRLGFGTSGALLEVISNNLPNLLDSLFADTLNL